VAAVKSDIIVVGGGPTGAFSALQATKLGAEVTVCEEHDRATGHSHCTGHVSLTGMKQLGLKLPEGLVENEIKSASFYSPSGCKFSVRFPASISCVINRGLFDQWLLDKSVDAGARVFHHTRVKFGQRCCCQKRWRVPRNRIASCCRRGRRVLQPCETSQAAPSPSSLDCEGHTCGS